MESAIRNPQSTIPHNLPRPTTPFVGREAELALIAQHLADDACRLVTLVGPGGTGKTRLALEAAARALPTFPEGVFLARLEGVTDPAFVAPALAGALAVPLQGQQDPEAQILHHLRARTTLLILDNCEQVLAGAGLMSAIVAECPGVKILATSREPLDLAEEWLLYLGGLPVPAAGTAAALTGSPAGQLFVQRARRASAGFILSEADAPAVRHICRLVGGLPLGIELAAAWVKLLAPAEIAQEMERNLDFLNTTLRHVPERHRSLRAVFEYSWHRLTEEEQRVFRRLAVFRGGFRREAAAAVVGARLPVLAALVDKSLLQSPGGTASGGRYERHLLLWQYAREKLEQAPAEQAAVEEQHGVYYADLLQQRAGALRGEQPQEALAELNAEIENVRAAWRWALEQQRLAAIAQGVESLASFYDTRGWYREGEEAFAQAVTALHTPGSPPIGEAGRLLGSVLARQGGFQASQGRLEPAEDLLRESVRILREVDAPAPGGANGGAGPRSDALRDLAHALQRLSWVVAQRGDHAQARQYGQESLALARRAGDERGVLHALIGLGLDAYKMGDYGEARRRYQESLALARELGDRVMMTYNLLRLGDTASAQGAYPAAEEHYRAGLQTAMEIAALPRAMMALIGLAQVRLATGDAAGAAELLAQPLRHPATEEADKDRAARLLEAATAALGPAAATAARERGQARPLVAVVEDLLGITLPQSLAALLAAPTFEVTLDLAQQADEVEAIIGTEFFARLLQDAETLRREIDAEGDEP